MDQIALLDCSIDSVINNPYSYPLEKYYFVKLILNAVEDGLKGINVTLPSDKIGNLVYILHQHKRQLVGSHVNTARPFALPPDHKFANRRGQTTSDRNFEKQHKDLVTLIEQLKDQEPLLQEAKFTYRGKSYKFKNRIILETIETAFITYRDEPQSALLYQENNFNHFKYAHQYVKASKRDSSVLSFDNQDFTRFYEQTKSQLENINKPLIIRFIASVLISLKWINVELLEDEFNDKYTSHASAQALLAKKLSAKLSY